MLQRTYLGLEICQQGLRAIAVQRRAKQIALVDGQTLALADAVVQPGFKELNIANPELFVQAVQKLLAPLAKRDNRIALALPDRAGQLFLLDIETPFKNRAEGAEMIRWQLKDRLPVPTNRVALDFQILQTRESGQKMVLAAVLSKEVLAQYEALIEQAGYAAAVVDFHCLALYNAYRTKIDPGRDFILVGVDGSQLSLLIFVNQVLIFSRQRTIHQDPRQVFQELNRTLVNYRHELPAFNRLAVYLHSDWPVQEALLQAVTAVFDQDVQCLISPVSKLMNGHQLSFGGAEASGMAAALGVAERMIAGER
ncbi:MAG: pilus assembly protein PilM [Desulfuromonadales bacterium]|nr:pilus assembly protein PilM [Desulfuromonadales bacterium]